MMMETGKQMNITITTETENVANICERIRRNSNIDEFVVVANANKCDTVKIVYFLATTDRTNGVTMPNIYEQINGGIKQ